MHHRKKHTSRRANKRIANKLARQAERHAAITGRSGVPRSSSSSVTLPQPHLYSEVSPKPRSSRKRPRKDTCPGNPNGTAHEFMRDEYEGTRKDFRLSCNPFRVYYVDVPAFVQVKLCVWCERELSRHKKENGIWSKWESNRSLG